MESRVGVLRCSYRILGNRATGAVPRLKDLAQQELLEAYSEALDQAFRDDPRVYVLKRVPAKLTFTNVSCRAETALVQEWGERLCGAVVRTIVAESRDAGNVVRFDEQAEYIAHFIRDLLNDRAWDQWFYGAFKSLQSLTKREALKAVLLQNRSHIVSIFRHLNKLDALTSAFALLQTEGMDWLWFEVISPRQTEADHASSRPLFMAAIQLARRLNVWVGPDQPEDSILPQYLALHREAPDWSASRGLAAAILDILRFLKERGYLTRPALASDSTGSDSTDTICREMDWLDSDWLGDEIRQLLTPQTAQTSTKASSPLTQSHRTLLEQIRLLLRNGAVSLDHTRPDGAANAALLFAALSTNNPELERIAGAPEIIQRLLVCWKHLQRISEPDALVRAFEENRLTSAIEAFPPEAQPAALSAFRAVTILQPQVDDVLRALLHPSSPAATSDAIWSCQGAGVFLLLRALQDLRLSQLVSRADIARLSDVLLGLGIAWGGNESLHLGCFDPALLVWANLSPYSQPDVPSLESPDFLAGMLELLHGRRAIESSAIHAFETTIRGRRALVFADASAAMFPLAAWLDASEQKSEIEASLIAKWQQATNVNPMVLRDSEGRQAFDAASNELISAWPIDVPPSLSITLSAIAGLRLWTHWLPGISTSSVPYLLKNLIRRPGTIQVTERAIHVRLQPGPIDIVLEMAGYLRKLESVPWLENRDVLFQIERRTR